MDKKDYQRKCYSMGHMPGRSKKPLEAQTERIVSLMPDRQQPQQQQLKEQHMASLSERIRRQQEQNKLKAQNSSSQPEDVKPKPREAVLFERQKQLINRTIAQPVKPQAHLLATPSRQQQPTAVVKTEPRVPQIPKTNVNRPSPTALQQLKRVGEALKRGNGNNPGQQRQVIAPRENAEAALGNGYEHHQQEEVTTVMKQITIKDPTKVHVHQQIKGSTVKMLMVLVSGEQRLITFDVPEDCTVSDLLDQVNFLDCFFFKLVFELLLMICLLFFFFFAA